MTPEDSLKMWTDRVDELEKALQTSIKVIKTLQGAAQWSGSQNQEIEEKLAQLEAALIPF